MLSSVFLFYRSFSSVWSLFRIAANTAPQKLTVTALLPLTFSLGLIMLLRLIMKTLQFHTHCLFVPKFFAVWGAEVGWGVYVHMWLG